MFDIPSFRYHRTQRSTQKQFCVFESVGPRVLMLENCNCLVTQFSAIIVYIFSIEVANYYVCMSMPSFSHVTGAKHGWAFIQFA